ncbi:MAG: hypothetical protein AAFO86_08240, partial [Pseudomonadota bacterium]
VSGNDGFWRMHILQKITLATGFALVRVCADARPGRASRPLPLLRWRDMVGAVGSQQKTMPLPKC